MDLSIAAADDSLLGPPLADAGDDNMVAAADDGLLGPPLDAEDDNIVAAADDGLVGPPLDAKDQLEEPLLGVPLDEEENLLGLPLGVDESVPGLPPHTFDLNPFQIDELRQPLTEECPITMLGLIERLLMNQMQTQASQRNTEATMDLVNEITQSKHPRTFKQAKALVNKTCMTHARQIHACIKDCIVFYNSPRLAAHQYLHLDWCPRCGAARYHPGTKTPVRVFHYIPIRDHVDAMFCRPDVVGAFAREGDGLPHGGNMNKTWSDLMDSPEWERVVHQDSFGNEVRVHFLTNYFNLLTVAIH